MSSPAVSASASAWRAPSGPSSCAVDGRAVRRGRPGDPGAPQNQFLELQHELKKSIVFVTHDIEEAAKLGDRIACSPPRCARTVRHARRGAGPTRHPVRGGLRGVGPRSAPAGRGQDRGGRPGRTPGVSPDTTMAEARAKGEAMDAKVGGRGRWRPLARRWVSLEPGVDGPVGPHVKSCSPGAARHDPARRSGEMLQHDVRWSRWSTRRTVTSASSPRTGCTPPCAARRWHAGRVLSGIEANGTRRGGTVHAARRHRAARVAEPRRGRGGGGHHPGGRGQRGAYATMNLGLHVGDRHASVVENRRRAAGRSTRPSPTSSSSTRSLQRSGGGPGGRRRPRCRERRVVPRRRRRHGDTSRSWCSPS